MRGFGRYVVLLLALVVIVNLPLFQAWRSQQKLDDEGVEVTVEVVDGQVLGGGSDPRYALEFTYADDLEGEPEERAAFVDRATYEEAMTTKQLEVRVLPDDPDSFRPEGEQTSNLLVVITLVADLVLLAFGALMIWRMRNPPEDDEPDLT